MNMLQRIVNAFASRTPAEREARAEMPVVPEYRPHPSTAGPGHEPGGEPESTYLREVDVDPSIAARRLWCSAGHF